MDESSKQWTQEQQLKLIAWFESQRCLWDFQYPDHKKPSAKERAWNNVTEALDCTPSQAKRKMHSLQASFRRERAKMPIRPSKWFAFKEMLALSEKINKRNPKAKPIPKPVSKILDTSLDETDIMEFDISDVGSATISSSPIKIRPKSILEKPQQRNLSNGSSQRDQRIYKRENEQKLSRKHQKTSNQRTERVNSMLSAESSPAISAIPTSLLTTTVSPSAFHVKMPNITPSHSVEDTAVISDLNATNICFDKIIRRDASEIFGEHVAAKHRKYNEHVKSVVEHLISKVFYEADMGKFERSKNGNKETIFRFDI